MTKKEHLKNAFNAGVNFANRNHPVFTFDEWFENQKDKEPSLAEELHNHFFPDEEFDADNFYDWSRENSHKIVNYLLWT